MAGCRRDVFADAANLFDVVATRANDCVDLRRHVEVCIARTKRTHGVNRRDGHVTKLNGVPTVPAQAAWGEDTQIFCFGVIQLKTVSQEPGSHFVKADDESVASCIKISWQS